jgi:hypothetical protein
MLRRSSMLFLRSLVSLVAAGYLLIHPGVSPAAAAQLTSQQVSQFLADPSVILKANPNGGGKLVSAIRDLMMSDACLPSPVAPQLASCEQVLKAIIALLANANEAQQMAIGSGLGQAAQSMVTTNPTLANDIQTALAASGVKVAVAAYQTTVGNLPIASAGGGAGGGGGNAAYQTEVNTGGGGGGGIQNSTGTGSAGFGLTGGGSVSGTGSSGSTTVTSAPVSPL